MRLALTPINPTVGDDEGNSALCAGAIRAARDAGADLVVLPELVLTGYPPRDLLWHEGFVDEAMARATSLASATRGVVAVVGCPWRGDGGAIYNSLLVMRDGRIADRYDKRLLPTYDVFDEDRYFTPGSRAVVVEVAGLRVGLAICEDLWRGDDAGVSARYRDRPDPVSELFRAGAQLIVVPSASPFVLGKAQSQRDILQRHAAAHHAPVAAVNQLGANDELVFDGHAAVFAPVHNGAGLIASSEPFDSSMLLVDLPAPAPAPTRDPLVSAEPERLLWLALTLGVRDYVRKTGFTHVVLGLSGGIDSAVTACVAAAALGSKNVRAIGLPSRHSSRGSVEDARALADGLGLGFEIVPIEPMHHAVERTLLPHFAALGADPEPGVAEENIQARLRGLTLMAFSNKLGALLLTTGNKSELAVGYCTLYGDMNGGLAVLSDVSKTLVYRLARWINANHACCGFAAAPIPPATIDKPPSAELKPDQTDQDTLPPYGVLDEIITRYVERRQSPGRIVAETGFEPATVARIARMIDLSEYKRRQAAIGLKVTSVAFGSGRRRPIAQGWRRGRTDTS